MVVDVINVGYDGIICVVDGGCGGCVGLRNGGLIGDGNGFYDNNGNGGGGFWDKVKDFFGF